MNILGRSVHKLITVSVRLLPLSLSSKFSLGKPVQIWLVSIRDKNLANSTNKSIIKEKKVGSGSFFILTIGSVPDFFFNGYIWNRVFLNI